MRITRSLALAAATPLLIAVLAGCSGDDESADDPGQGGSSVPTEAPPVGEKINTREFATLIADAFGQNDTADMELQIINGGMVTVSKGQVDYSHESPRVSLSLSVPATGEGEMHSIVIDNIMYVSLPQPEDETRIYYELDLNDEDNPLVRQLGGLNSFDPKASVEVFAQGLQEVYLVGNDTINGVATNHYVVTTSTSSLEDLADASAVPETLTYDVWLDESGQMIKMESDLPGQGSMKLVMSNWGGEVDIAAPPAAQVEPYPTGGATESP
ncbi:LppX_LprAFG lipoprotein [Nocardioides sp. AE5]|uniref:LppX_LprAFG lipoprotein n=1 Tax=Nocardioides sp. AE5 TaxID=2962573 RepID=UPI00288244D3|nr:LppX_LprAFG lipoprotein [Nocardioides sp. AE5]MDT0201744.1 LppX_LprAFG lipoprotein [Nocardioides sp. AE5]